MWILSTAKGPPTTFGSIVGGLPGWVVQEHTQPCEVVSIQMLLLLAERRELSSCRILIPETMNPSIAQTACTCGCPRLASLADVPHAALTAPVSAHHAGTDFQGMGEHPLPTGYRSRCRATARWWAWGSGA
jgi:hypothetical protein